MSLATERRAARERALGLLYEAESKGVDGAAVLAELPVPADPFAEALVRAVDEHRAQIDALLERFAQGWTLGRMAALDRAALRMGTAELIVRDDVPTGVVIPRFDATVPVKRQHRLAESIPHARVWEVDGAHDVCATDPPAFVPALLEACRHATVG